MTAASGHSSEQSGTTPSLIVTSALPAGCIDTLLSHTGFCRLLENHTSLQKHDIRIWGMPADQCVGFSSSCRGLSASQGDLVDAVRRSTAVLALGTEVGAAWLSDEKVVNRLTDPLLCAILAGVPTAVLGFDVMDSTRTSIPTTLSDLLSRVDLVTAGRSEAAMALAGGGIINNVQTATDFAFALPATRIARPGTPRVGIHLTQALTNNSPSVEQELISAIEHLSRRLPEAPVVFVDDTDAGLRGAQGFASGSTMAEIVGQAELNGFQELTARFAGLDLVMTDSPRFLVAAALHGIPSLPLVGNEMMAGLARQLRLGNYALDVHRLRMQQVLRNVQRLYTRWDHCAQTVFDAANRRAREATKHTDQLHTLLQGASTRRFDLPGPDDFCEQLQPPAAGLATLLAKHASPAGSVSVANAGDYAPSPLPENPLVTVYICAYNAERYIEDALRSALNQTYRNLEILVVDDGSTDDTVARVKAFTDDRIVLHTIAHGGIARARTHAKKHARGDLILCLDADDWIAPQLVEKQVRLFQENPEIDVGYCHYTLVDAHGNPQDERWEYPDYAAPEQLLAEMFQGGRGRIPGGSLMERREICERMNGYDESLEVAEDFEYAARLATVARGFKGVHEPLYYYRNFMAGNSGKWLRRNQTIAKVWQQMWERHGGEVLLGKEIGRNLSGNARKAAYACRAGEIALQHAEAYLVSGGSRPFFECASTFFLEALNYESHNYAAGSNLMKLAAMGEVNLTDPNGPRSIPELTEILYPNQAQLDVLFEVLLPKLWAAGEECIEIAVFDSPQAGDAVTLALETLRRGIPRSRLAIRCYRPTTPDTVELSHLRYNETDLCNTGRSSFPRPLLHEYFTREESGHYRLNAEVVERIEVLSLDITQAGVSLPRKPDILFATTIWHQMNEKTAQQILTALRDAIRDEGYLFLGGFFPARHATMPGHRELEPVRERFEDVHNGWRHRRGCYGIRSFALPPLDRRYPDWPWRFGCIFKKREMKSLDLKAPDLLKTYWTERGKVYQQQYPTKPLDEMPVPARMIQALREDKSDSVLDYGCGYGLLTREAHRALPAAKLIGLDISRTVLLDAYKYLLGNTPIGLVESDGKTIPLPDDSIDTIFTHVTLIHVPHEEIRGVLAEMVRVARKTLYLGETAYKEHEQFYYFAHDYPALLAEMGYEAVELDVPNSEKQPGAHLYRVDVSREAVEARVSPKRSGQRLLVVSDRRSVHTRRFCRYFREQGHEVHLYDAGTDWEGLADIIQHAADPVRYPEGNAQRQLFARAARLREVITAIQPDWVHGHFLAGWGWWSALAAHDVPLALTAWGSDVFLLSDDNPHVREFTRWSAKQAHFLTADSQALAAATESLIDGQRPVHLVPFGIDTNQFKPGVDTTTLRRQLLIPDEARVILSPRQIKSGANIQFIIDAFAEIHQEHPETVLVLKTYLTTFETQSEFMALIRKKISDLGLWRHVRIVHDLPYEAMPALYELAEATVSVRDTDGTPCTLFESCAVGTPVIASDIPSLSEWITNGENGLLVPTRSSAAIARALRQVLSGGPDIDSLKKQARAFACENGDHRRCFARIEECFSGEDPTPAGPEGTYVNRAAFCAAVDRQDCTVAARLFEQLASRIVSPQTTKRAAQASRSRPGIGIPA